MTPSGLSETTGEIRPRKSAMTSSMLASWSLSPSLSSSSSSSVSRVALCLSCLLLFAPLPADGYFNRMMSCPQFCQMLAHSQIHQMWCIIDICHGMESTNQVLRYAKRASGQTSSLTPSRDGADDVNKSLRMLLGLRNVLPGFVFAKRDKEYWEGPAPADINH